MDGSSSAQHMPTSSDEEVYVQLYYSLLLALAHNEAKPIVQLFNSAQVLLMHTYLASNVTDDDNSSPAQVNLTAEKKHQFIRLRDTVVPNLVAKIKQQNDKNFWAEDKNRLSADSNLVEHDELWKIVVTPSMVRKYRDLLEALDIKEMIEYPEDFPALWDFLNGIIEEQYSFEAWVHVSSLNRPAFNQLPFLTTEDKFEEFQDYSVDQTKILVYTKVKIPGADEYFSQIDLIPRLQSSGEETSGPSHAADSKRKIYFNPAIEDIVVPEKSRDPDVRWIPVDSSKREWTRSDGVSWTCRVLTREFDETTHQYIRPRMLSPEWLVDINPNDPQWTKRYNKHYHQLERRRTGAVLVARAPWDERERAALYTTINTWCATHGVDRFNGTFNSAMLKHIAATVSQVRNIDRSVDSVRSQIETAHAAKNKEIYQLKLHGQAMKARIDGGENVPHNERFPSEAISLPRASTLVVKLVVGAENLP